MKIELPDDVKFIIDRLMKCGFDAYVVGGCVRDSILGRTPKDWDICTSANPEETMTAFADFHVIPTGIRHGTVTVIVEGLPYEITTFRVDGNYSDGRHPDEVTFVRNLREDLARRDFTINAMAYNDTEGLIDPFNGLLDLEVGMIRCVGSPEERFKEDALRMLRAIRFQAQLDDFIIAMETWIAIVKLAETIKNVSWERIRDEFSKILLSSHTSTGIEQLLWSGLLAYIVPEFTPCFVTPQNNKHHIADVARHTMYTLKNIEPKLHLRLAMFLHDIGKPTTRTTDENGEDHFYGHADVSADLAENILRRLKFDNDMINKVVTLVKNHDVTFEESKSATKRWLNRLGEEAFFDMLEVRTADIKAHNTDTMEERLYKVCNMRLYAKGIISSKECFTLKDLAINGDDLIGIGYKQNKDLGVALNNLLDVVIEFPEQNEKSVLLEIAKDMRQKKILGELGYE